MEFLYHSELMQATADDWVQTEWKEQDERWKQFKSKAMKDGAGWGHAVTKKPNMWKDEVIKVDEKFTANPIHLLDAHRKVAMTSPGSLSRVDDPVQAHVEIYGAWVARLLASGQVRCVDGHSISLVPSRIPRLVLKTWAAWLH